MSSLVQEEKKMVCPSKEWHVKKVCKLEVEIAKMIEITTFWTGNTLPKKI